jgi:twitching motility protein PilT
MNPPTTRGPTPEQSALAYLAGLTDQPHQLPREFLEPTDQGKCPIPLAQKLTTEHSLPEILLYARHNQASDVHLTVNTPIILRRYGVLVPQTDHLISTQRMENLIRETIPTEKLSSFLKFGDLEFVYTIRGGGRYRITIIKQRLGWALTARVIPHRIRTLQESGMPLSCAQLTKWAQGMVLVTGPVGCGKTSSLATLIEMINQTRRDHIITIEDPIEIVYTSQKCQITQREINKHTLCQAHALRAALREDPDILVVSELRDLESIQLAVTAAETGHLVLGTMNTNTASQTITSLINSFPPEERSIITNMISESLRGVICQQLVPKKNGTGVVPAYEVLIMKTAISNMIRKNSLQHLNNVIATGRADGMVLMDNSLQELVDNGTITTEEAMIRAVNKSLFGYDPSFPEIIPNFPDDPHPGGPLGEN